MHDFTWTFSVSFTDESYVVTGALWINTITDNILSRTLTSITFKCNRNHMSSYYGHIALGY